MMRPVSLGFVLLLGILVASPVRADHFALRLFSESGKENKTAEAVFPAPEGKPQARAVLTTGVNVPIKVKWTVKNIDEKAAAKDVLVHFFAVKIDKPNQQDVPKLTKNVIVESALNMDFRPQDKSAAEITFSISDPGCYLLRLELKGAASKEGREPFAALELLVR